MVMESVRKIISEEVSKVFEDENNDKQRLKHAYALMERMEVELNEATGLLARLHDLIESEIGSTDCKALLIEVFQELREWRMNP